MGRLTLQVDSVRQTGLESTLQEVLTVVESRDGQGGQKWSESLRIGADFACTATTGVAMDKRI